MTLISPTFLWTVRRWRRSPWLGVVAWHVRPRWWCWVRLLAAMSHTTGKGQTEGIVLAQRQVGQKTK
jgi:hypothetical protein